MKLPDVAAAGAELPALRYQGLRWPALVGCALLLACWAWGGGRVVEGLLPAAKAWIEWLEPAFTVRQLRVVQSPQGERIELQVSLARPLRVGQVMVMPHPRGRAQARVPLAQGLQGPLLLGLVAVGWPIRHAAEAVVRALLVLPLTGLLLALDAPIVLLSEIWALLRQAHADDGWHPLVSWAGLLSNGGRYGLALLAAAAVVCASGAGIGGASTGAVRHGQPGKAGLRRPRYRIRA